MANTLEIVIKATDKASKEIGAVTKGIDGLGKAGGAIFKTVSIAAATAATAVGAVGAAIVKLAVDAVPLQGIEAAFQGITDGSAEMLDALRASSNGMLRDTELMKSYNLAAQLVGKEFADKLPDAMGYLQKVAAATGQDMSYMMDSLVRGVGRMSPMILDNLGIQVTLEEATAEAAAMFGVEASELTKVQLQAGMTNVVMRALERNTASMPEVAGSAAQQWAAFNTQLANFKDRIGMGALPILQRILGTVEDAGMGGWLDKISGWFSDSLVPSILGAWDRIETFFHNLAGGAPLEGAIRVLLSGILSPDDIEGLIDITKWVSGLTAAIQNGDWTTAGNMLRDKLSEGLSSGLEWMAGATDALLRWVNDPATIGAMNSIGMSLGRMIGRFLASFFGLQGSPEETETGAQIENMMGRVRDNISATLQAIGREMGGYILAGIVEGLTGKSPQASVESAIAQAKATPPSWYTRFWEAYKAWYDSLPSWATGSVTGESMQLPRQFQPDARAIGGYSSGITLVGERGPELVSLPSGSYVHDSSESRQMMSGPTVNFGPGAIVIQGNATARDVEVGVLRGLRAAGVAV